MLFGSNVWTRAPLELSEIIAFKLIRVARVCRVESPPQSPVGLGGGRFVADRSMRQLRLVQLNVWFLSLCSSSAAQLLVMRKNWRSVQAERVISVIGGRQRTVSRVPITTMWLVKEQWTQQKKCIKIRITSCYNKSSSLFCEFISVL